VLPEAVIDRQVAGQPVISLIGVLVGHRVGPFPAERLDEPLSFAVGSGRVGPAADVPEPQGAAGLGERLGDVGRTVVAHHPSALDPLTVEPCKRPSEEADHRWLLLVLQHLDVRQPRGVVDGDMNLGVADAVGAPLLAITGDSMAELAEAGQGLDVDVEQIARPLPLVTLHWWLGFKIPETAQVQPAEGPGDGRERGVQQPGDVA